jgi:hypothetical protein
VIANIRLKSKWNNTDNYHFYLLGLCVGQNWTITFLAWYRHLNKLVLWAKTSSLSEIMWSCKLKRFLRTSANQKRHYLKSYNNQYYCWRKPEYPEKTTDLPQVTVNLLSHNVVTRTPRMELESKLQCYIHLAWLLPPS